jgi:hypothetical protein
LIRTIGRRLFEPGEIDLGDMFAIKAYDVDDAALLRLRRWYPAPNLITCFLPASFNVPACPVCAGTGTAVSATAGKRSRRPARVLVLNGDSNLY